MNEYYDIIIQNNHFIDFKKNTHTWSILELHFDNLFGYGKKNSIYFHENRPKIIGIFGNNSVGKSTIIDIILFLLYGKITRYSNGNSIPKEVIHENEIDFKASIRLRIDNEIYHIQKQGKREKKNHEKIKIIEKFFKEDEEKNLHELTEEYRKKTDKLIKNMIGDIEHFLFLSVCLQKSNQLSFKDMTQKDKKEFLFSLFHLNCFEEYKIHLQNELKLKTQHFLQLETQLKEYDGDFSFDHEKYEQEKINFHQFLEMKTHVTTHIKKLEQFQIKFEMISSLLEKHISQKSRLEKEYNQYKHIKNIERNNDISSLTDSIHILQSDINNLYSNYVSIPSLSSFHNFSYTEYLILKNKTFHFLQNPFLSRSLCFDEERNVSDFFQLCTFKKKNSFFLDTLFSKK
jgi:DNA repair exonuclease SbcCD ATPase subunit